MAPSDAHVLRAEIVDAPVPTVRATGELDLSTVAQLCHTIHTAALANPRLIVDLSKLRFCDSTGLRGLIGAMKEVDVLGGRAVMVVEPGGMLDRLLDLSGLREFLRVTDSFDTARRHLTT
jgi:anti-anti-sigma factor